jgi:hypothetical protein
VPDLKSVINNTAMDTNGLTSRKKPKFQLVKISPSESLDVIMSLIDEKINFHQNKGSKLGTKPQK